MAKKLKQIATFSGKKYKRGTISYKTKAEAIKKAKKLKEKGAKVVRDKNSKGHFLWINEGSVKSKAKSTKKPSVKKSVKKARVKNNFDKYYDRHNAKISKFSVSVDRYNEKSLEIIADRAKKAGFKVDYSHSGIIDYDTIGYYQDFELKTPRRITKTLIKRIETVINPVREDVYVSYIDYKMKDGDRNIHTSFQGTKSEKIEKEIKKTLKEGRYRIW